MKYLHAEGVIKQDNKKLGLFVAALAYLVALITSFVGGANAAGPAYTLFGDAEIVAVGNPGSAAQIRSDADPGWGGINFEVTPGATFADLTVLSTDYKFEPDDRCNSGSPRFQVNMDSGTGDTGNIFVYIGPAPNYTLCAPDVWSNTGDLLEGANAIDTSQLDGGTFYHPYSTAAVLYAEYEVTGIQLVVDSGYTFGDGEQTVLIDNTNVNGEVQDYEPVVPILKDDCKKGGWMNFTDASFTPFKNQGDCVSYVATAGRNPANGH